MDYFRCLPFIPAPSALLSLSFSFSVALSGAAHAEAQVYTELGPDLPPVGRSLFDYLVIEPPQNGVVPFNFAKVADLIAAKLDDKPKRILIPKGRSLRRSAAAPDFFRYPRLVVGAGTAVHKQKDGDLGYFLTNRIYIGHVEKDASFEVVSYNEAAGRFEFQLVRDYNTAVPRVVYANRATCSFCHQSQAPIFSDAPWSETNGVVGENSRVADLIKKAMPPGTTDYLGFPLEVSRTDTVYRFDNSIIASNEIPAVQKLWIDACGRETVEAMQCRGLTLKLALSQFILNPASFTTLPDYVAVKAVWDVNWNQFFPGGLRLGNSRLINRDPLEQVSANTRFTFNNNSLAADVRAEIIKDIGTSDIPPEFEPSNRKEGRIIWTVGAGDQNNAITGLLRNFFTTKDKILLKKSVIALGGANPDQLISSAINKMIRDNQSGRSDSLGARAFRRGVVMRGFLTAIGISSEALPRSCCDADSPDMPRAIADLQGGGGIFVGEHADELGLFFKRCAQCHGANSDLPENRLFLKEINGSPWQRFCDHTSKIVVALANGEMPPSRPAEPEDVAEFDDDIRRMKVIAARVSAEVVKDRDYCKK